MLPDPHQPQGQAMALSSAWMPRPCGGVSPVQVPCGLPGRVCCARHATGSEQMARSYAGR